MKVTVCELPDDRKDFVSEWKRLIAHVKQEASELVLLPEMPFSKWFMKTSSFSRKQWDKAVEEHQQWELQHLPELLPSKIYFSKPYISNETRYNMGCLFEKNSLKALHEKFYLPNEEPVWESSWYSRGSGSFIPFESNSTKFGFLICTEIWFFEKARAYGNQGVDVLLTPRKTALDSVDKWLVAGRAAAISAGCYSLSSNTISTESQGLGFGGTGWIIDPEGCVLAKTSRERPFVTMSIDLSLSAQAKKTYPRNVPE